jgi:hypothetical protein
MLAYHPQEHKVKNGIVPCVIHPREELVEPIQNGLVECEQSRREAKQVDLVDIVVGGLADQVEVRQVQYAFHNI